MQGTYCTNSWAFGYRYASKCGADWCILFSTAFIENLYLKHWGYDVRIEKKLLCKDSRIKGLNFLVGRTTLNRVQVSSVLG